MSALAARARGWLRSEQGDASGRAEIKGRRIYILPTRYGVLFAMLLFLMLIGALNYDSNPAYLLTFFLVSIGLNAMYLTWRNLRGVQVQLLHSEPVFCGQDVELRFQLRSGDHTERPAIQVRIDDLLAADDLPEDGDQRTLKLALPTGRRGWLYPGQVIVSTHYPLGFFRAWCYVELTQRILVYPRLGPRDKRIIGDHNQEGDGESQESGQEDFYGLREYRHGDSPRHIDWKTLARERGVMSKQFTQPRGHTRLIDWERLAGLELEKRLSRMARAVVDADEAGEAYALKLPGLVIESDLGLSHRHSCLSALACYGEDR